MRCRINGEDVDVTVLSVSGPCLLGHYRNGQDEFVSGVICSNQAIDEAAFWQLWNELGGRLQGVDLDIPLDAVAI